MRLEPGCVLGLLGANGAGKTTLLRLLIGLHRPTAGWAKVFGKTMTPNSADLRRRIGYIPTNPQFPRGMTPITYLDYMARLFGLPADVRKPRLASLIRAVDLLGASGHAIDGFSNGMTARLAVAASLINEPDLLIWDEPTHGLDPEARRSMLDLIKTLAREKTLIVSSHNLSDIDEVCNHAAVLSHGQLIYCGSLQDLKGRMRRNHFELDLEGEQKAVAKATAAIRALAGLQGRQPAPAAPGAVPARRGRQHLRPGRRLFHPDGQQGDAGQHPQRRPADGAGVSGPGREGRVARLRAHLSGGSGVNFDTSRERQRAGERPRSLAHRGW